MKMSSKSNFRESELLLLPFRHEYSNGTEEMGGEEVCVRSISHKRMCSGPFDLLRKQEAYMTHPICF